MCIQGIFMNCISVCFWLTIVTVKKKKKSDAIDALTFVILLVADCYRRFYCIIVEINITVFLPLTDTIE